MLAIVDFPAVEAYVAERRISVRTGCFCNPGASETARGITAQDMRRVVALGHQPTLDESRSIVGPKALGAVRASVGIATDERDVDRLVAALEAWPD